MPEKVRDKDRERDHRYGRLLKPCCDQAHTVAPLAEAEEPLNPDAVSVVLVSDLLIRLLLLFIFRTTPSFGPDIRMPCSLQNAMFARVR